MLIKIFNKILSELGIYTVFSLLKVLYLACIQLTPMYNSLFVDTTGRKLKKGNPKTIFFLFTYIIIMVSNTNNNTWISTVFVKYTAYSGVKLFIDNAGCKPNKWNPKLVL